MKIIQSVFSTHSEIKLIMNRKKKTKKSQNTCESNNGLLIYVYIEEKNIKRNIKYIKVNNNKNTTYQKLGKS